MHVIQFGRGEQAASGQPTTTGADDLALLVADTGEGQL